jgi:hypothetical protein
MEARPGRPPCSNRSASRARGGDGAPCPVRLRRRDRAVLGANKRGWSFTAWITGWAHGAWISRTLRATIALGDANGDGLRTSTSANGRAPTSVRAEPDAPPRRFAAAGVDWLERTRSALFDLDNGDQIRSSPPACRSSSANDGKGHFDQRDAVGPEARLGERRGPASVVGLLRRTPPRATSARATSAAPVVRPRDDGGGRLRDDGFVDIYATALLATRPDFAIGPVP